MARNHDTLVEEAKTAIQEVHGDTSVTQHQTIKSLREIAEEIEVMISSVEADIERDEADYDPSITGRDDTNDE